MKSLNKYALYLLPILIICCVVMYFFCCSWNATTTTVFLVRHADRDDGVDTLNAAGEIRAQELARILEEANITSIYSSNYNRTKQTAAPLATQLGMTVVIYDANNLSALATDILNNHIGEVILVVGHSNTVGPTIGALGVSPSPPDIPHDDYDNLYLVTINSRGTDKMVKMEFGVD